MDGIGFNSNGTEMHVSAKDFQGMIMKFDYSKVRPRFRVTTLSDVVKIVLRVVLNLPPLTKIQYLPICAVSWRAQSCGHEKHRIGRFVYDVLYWTIVPMLLLNMVAGIILDR